MFKIGVILMALTATLFGNWFIDLFDRTPTPTITIPIDLSKKGTIVDTVFRVNYDESTRFSLDFECKDVKLDGGLDCTQLEKFLGFNIYLGGDGKKINNPSYESLKRRFGNTIEKSYNLDGTKIPLKLTLSNLKEDKPLSIVLNKTYYTKGHNTGGNSRYIVVKHIQKGKYKLKVENLKAFSELKERKIEFRIQSTYRK